MNNRIIKINISKKGNKIAYVVVSPSIEQFVSGAKARLVRTMATDIMKVGGSIDLAQFTVGLSDVLPPRTDGKPSAVSEITWLDAK